MQVRAFEREWQVTELIDPYRRYLELDSRSERQRVEDFLYGIIVGHEDQRAWRTAWRETSATSEVLIKCIEAIVAEATGVDALTYARLGTFAFDDQTWRQLRGQLLIQGRNIDRLLIGEFIDVTWAAVAVMYSGWDSPMEFRSKLYDWFFKGIEPKSKDQKGKPGKPKMATQDEIQKMGQLNDMLKQMKEGGG